MTATGWGVLGPGRIADAFARDLRLVPGAELAAVGSRSAERAAAFAAEHGFAASYGSYDALLADPAVEAVYVASPHALHVEHVTAALEAGRHVLCEKPLTLRAADAEALFALARSRGLLLMEAMWTACHPVVLAVRDALRERPARHARATCTPRWASSPTCRRRTGCSTRRSAPARCSTWASTRSPWRTCCSARPRR